MQQLAMFDLPPATAPRAALTASLNARQIIALPGFSEAVALYLAPPPKRCVMSSWSALLAYVRGTMMHDTRESFRVLFLDKKNALIADEVMGRGTVDHAPVYPREVVRRALELDASAVILVHNHPSGDPTPSAADIDMTRQVVDAGRLLRIAVHDHLIVGRDAEALLSMKGQGLF